ncbi:MAG TPA: hypothetical protein VIH99_13390 [Bdellovibrionota bacterium]|jgi:hypothetical protein
MRQIALASLLLSSSAWALPAQVESQISATSTSGAAAVDFRGTSPQVSNYSSTISGRSPGLWNDSLIASVSLTTAKNDYSTTSLTNEEGQSTPLSDRFHGAETSAEFGLEWKGGAHTASLSYGQMLTQASPYPYRAVSAGYNVGFFSNATVLGTNLSWARQEQPLSFHTDARDLRIRAKPLALRSERAELWLEQVLTERWKMQVKGIAGQRIEDRPLHLGGELRNAYALTDRLSARLDTGLLRERRGEALKDEKGYFTTYWGELQATYEVIYDLLLTASAGTTVEREEVPWSGAQNQVGTDTYGLKASYRGRSWTVNLSGKISRSNTSYRSRGIQGGFVWEI